MSHQLLTVYTHLGDTLCARLVNIVEPMYKMALESKQDWFLSKWVFRQQLTPWQPGQGVAEMGTCFPFPGSETGFPVDSPALVQDLQNRNPRNQKGQGLLLRPGEVVPLVRGRSGVRIPSPCTPVSSCEQGVPVWKAGKRCWCEFRASHCMSPTPVFFISRPRGRGHCPGQSGPRSHTEALQQPLLREVRVRRTPVHCRGTVSSQDTVGPMQEQQEPALLRSQMSRGCQENPFHLHVQTWVLPYVSHKNGPSPGQQHSWLEGCPVYPPPHLPKKVEGSVPSRHIPSVRVRAPVGAYPGGKPIGFLSH